MLFFMKLSGISCSLLIICLLVLSNCGTSKPGKLKKLRYSVIESYNPSESEMSIQIDPSYFYHPSGRNVKLIPWQRGQSAFRICLFKDGTISELNLIEDETTIQKKEMRRAAYKWLSEHRYEKFELVSELQCGKIIFTHGITR